jgi:prepilin-type N-terminal cleavage/methylation domain-containing protein
MRGQEVPDGHSAVRAYACHIPTGRAFSLIELIIVILIIGIIGAIAVPKMGMISSRSMANATHEAYNRLEQGVLIYEGDNQGFPPDPPSPGEYMDELDGYIGQLAWDTPAPIGGEWDWIGPGKPTVAGIAVYSAAGPTPKWLKFDQLMDDGSLLSGKYKRSTNWMCRPLMGATRTRTVVVGGAGAMGVD